MESGKMNYRKILQWTGLVIGTVIAATIIAVIIFFNSIPQKPADQRIAGGRDPASPSTWELKVENYEVVEPEKNNFRNNNRDPFSPPASAWAGLMATAGFIVEESPIKVPENKSHPITGKRSKTTVEKKKQQYPSSNSQIKTGLLPNQLNQDQQDPNSPEYKETLILPSVGQENTEAHTATYVMKKGETIASVSRKFGVTADIIYKTNGITVKDKSVAGKILVIPIPKSHLYRVKAKETLWRIATRYGVSVEILKEINNFSDSTKLILDQIIILPVPIDKIKNKNY